jgi:hypothetical protein
MKLFNNTDVSMYPSNRTSAISPSEEDEDDETPPLLELSPCDDEDDDDDTFSAADDDALDSPPDELDSSPTTNVSPSNSVPSELSINFATQFDDDGPVTVQT